MDYSEFLIKEYTYWSLFLNNDQRYLGRTYAWLTREGGMQRFSQITDEESAELKLVMREYESVLEKIWKPDFMNYAWLANLFQDHGGHGHLHLIPRYKDSRTFAGTEFIDGRWGKNYSPSEEFNPSKEILIQIRDAIKEKI